MKAFIIPTGKSVCAFKKNEQEDCIDLYKWIPTRKENMFMIEDISHDPVLMRVQDSMSLSRLEACHDGEIKFNPREYYIFRDPDSEWFMAVHARYVVVG
jgi:hypothetical protein